MIRRRTPPKEDEQVSQRGFDDFDVTLGDVMRGERATLGKSLLDVQRELKIKATYIAAIENTDPSAFETPGFIAGYVRSYARYLGLDSEWAFETFCEESDFTSVSGLDKSPSQGAVAQKTAARNASDSFDPIRDPRVAFAPVGASALSRIEPRAIGSTLVLLALVGAIGYGGWTVLQEIQRVQVTPVDRAPGVVAQVDSLSGTSALNSPAGSEIIGLNGGNSEALDRLYRPQALDVPVMVARDGPIAAIDPSSVGALAAFGGSGGYSATDRLANATPAVVPRSQASAIDLALAEALGQTGLPNGAAAGDDPLQTAGLSPRVTAEGKPEVVIVAIRPAWIRVRAADGSVLLEKTMNAGDSYVVPATEEPPTLRTGAAGGIFFSVNGQTYGPAGGNGAVVDKIALSSEDLTAQYALADTTTDADAREAVAVAEAAIFSQPPATPGLPGTTAD